VVAVYGKVAEAERGTEADFGKEPHLLAAGRRKETEKY
jgi:hypothetical protein